MSDEFQRAVALAGLKKMFDGEVLCVCSSSDRMQVAVGARLLR